MIDAKIQARQDFVKFTSGALGAYNSCIITEIFAVNKKEKSDIKLIYTLAIFTTDTVNLKEKIINKGTTIAVQKIPNYVFGIKEYSLDIQSAKQLFDDLLEKNTWGNIPCDLNICGSKFVQVAPNNEIVLNNVLRNNFFNGSYIQEFFDFKKTFFKTFLEDQTLLNELSSQIYNFRSIDIAAVPDRLGNIIFQFPACKSYFDIHALKNGNIQVDMEPFTPNLVAIITNDNDDYGVIDHYYLKQLDDKNNVVPSGELDKIAQIVYDSTNDVIIHSVSNTYFIKSINVGMHLIGGHASAIRKFKNIDSGPNNTESGQIVSLAINRPADNIVKIGDEYKPDYVIANWIKKREYRASLINLMEDYKFRQFFDGEREEALTFIRNIINKYGQQEIYIWDPYCTTIDICNTAFYANHLTSIKIIADYHSLRKLESEDKCKSKNDKKEQKSKFDQWKNEQVQQFNDITQGAEQFLKIKYKVRFNCGFTFHDRFIVCRDQHGSYHAWQLGTSINQVGGHHHIISQLADPKNILDAFNDLWDQLFEKDCLVWQI